jgi:hypothetical protein
MNPFPVLRFVASAMLSANLGLACEVRGDVDRSGYPAEAPNHGSYVRGNISKSLMHDGTYASLIAKHSPTAQVDILMQQCYGAGFLDNVIGELKEATFTSASAWNEQALCNCIEWLGAADDYTRASVEAHVRSAAWTMRSNFRVATKGLPKLQPALEPDPYATTGDTPQPKKEHPHFGSNDPAPNPGDLLLRPNDDRSLHHSPETPQYAILVQWGKRDLRVFAIHQQRQYEMLRSRYGVPADNIAVLYGNGTLAKHAASSSWEMNGMPDGIPEVKIDAASENAIFEAALKGDYFKVDGTHNKDLAANQARNIPTAKSKLYIYNNGHGGHGTWNNTLKPDGTNQLELVSTPGGANFALLPELIDDENLRPMFVDPDGLVTVQVTTDGPIDPHIVCLISGTNPLGGMTAVEKALVNDPAEAIDIRAFLELGGLPPDAGPLFAYTMTMPYQSVLNAAKTGIEIGFGNVFKPESAKSILAVTFVSGMQEYTHAFTKKPSGMQARNENLRLEVTNSQATDRYAMRYLDGFFEKHSAKGEIASEPAHQLQVISMRISNVSEKDFVWDVSKTLRSKAAFLTNTQDRRIDVLPQVFGPLGASFRGLGGFDIADVTTGGQLTIPAKSEVDVALVFHVPETSVRAKLSMTVCRPGRSADDTDIFEIALTP